MKEKEGLFLPENAFVVELKPHFGLRIGKVRRGGSNSPGLSHSTTNVEWFGPHIPSVVFNQDVIYTYSSALAKAAALAFGGKEELAITEIVKFLEDRCNGIKAEDVERG